MFPSEKIQDAIIEGIKGTKLKDAIAYFICWLIILMAFWFVDIYLIAHNFYAHTPLLITIIISFCLSFGLMFLSISGELAQTEDKTGGGLYLFSGIYSIIILGTFSAAWVIMRGAIPYVVSIQGIFDESKLPTFKNLIIVVFGYRFLQIVIVRIRNSIKKRKDANPKNS